MDQQTSIVVTSIAKPNQVLQTIARECNRRGVYFCVVGDEPSPADFHIDGCEFYSIERQRDTGFRFASICPLRHYARKNIGYLLAIERGSRLIVETDDDNIPGEEFWARRTRGHSVPLAVEAGWLNVYAYFSDANIWPRGLPLDAVQRKPQPFDQLRIREVDAPIQQGLADENPDVDAIYRLVLPLPQYFLAGRRVALARGVWCPFNSQNTAWWPEAFALLYLPAYCSFRMTDIWRSFVAQRIAWENGWSLLFESASVRQERNEHALLRDFRDEIPGYLHNEAICERLEALSLKAGIDNIPENLRRCYETFIRENLIEEREFDLLDAWLSDVRAIRG